MSNFCHFLQTHYINPYLLQVGRVRAMLGAIIISVSYVNVSVAFPSCLCSSVGQSVSQSALFHPPVPVLISLSLQMFRQSRVLLSNENCDILLSTCSCCQHS